jgi:secondary thiamine-phosphate synthase enzyme
LVQEEIEKQEKDSGLCHLFATHTTCSLTTADLDPGTDQDMLDAWREMIPKINFRHPHNPSHAPDHILSSTVGTNLTIPFQNKKLILGTWQRIVLVEFDGPRTRRIILSVLG